VHGTELPGLQHDRHRTVQGLEAILSWYRGGGRILDIGCSGGLHALELAKRGYQVTGLDVESSAIGLARQRNRKSGLDAVFFVADVENVDLTSFGKFDLVCSLGNVMSHIPKKSLPVVMGKVRQCMETDGIFLFDVLAVGASFPEKVHEKELGIIWKRRFDRETGEIFLRGIFENFGITQDFRVWGYTREQIVEMLKVSGFSRIDVSDSLDFSTAGTTPVNPVCLKFRAWMGEEN
jgi:SAM-dependent methyltransferase